MTVSASYAGCAAMGRTWWGKQSKQGGKAGWMGVGCGTCTMGVVGAMGKWRSGVDYPGAGHEDKPCMNDGRGAYLYTDVK